MDERIRLAGNYNSESAQTLALTFEKCDPTKRSTCKSEEETREFMKTKNFVTIENSFSFRQDLYDE